MTANIEYSEVDCSVCGFLYKAGSSRGCPHCNPKPEEVALQDLEMIWENKGPKTFQMLFEEMYQMLDKYFKAKLEH